MAMPISNTLKGIFRGRTIELTEEPGLPDGQPVSVVVHTMSPTSDQLPLGEGLRRAFGACADEAADLDEFLRLNRQLRQLDRPDIKP